MMLVMRFLLQWPFHPALLLRPSILPESTPAISGGGLSAQECYRWEIGRLGSGWDSVPSRSQGVHGELGGF
jgi:hypothetical protein